MSARLFLSIAIVALQLADASAVSVQPQDLAHWLSSQDGLQMSQSDAAALANQNYLALTGSGVTVTTLQAMRDKMFTKYPKGMSLDLKTIQVNIFKLVEQHINPDNLFKLFCHLYEGYTSYGGLDLPMSEAQTRAIPIALQRTDPDNLYYLYKVMYGYGGLGFKQDLARTQAVQEAIAGADPDVFKESWKKSPNLQDAITSSVDAYLQSLPKRYAKDGKLYTAKEFQDYYPKDWLTEWTAAPMEKKVSSDKKAYTAGSYSRHYGDGWAAKWRTCNTATQVRLAEDGKQYTLDEFQQYYKGSWQQKFADAPELACKECTPYDDAALAGDLVV